MPAAGKSCYRAVVKACACDGGKQQWYLVCEKTCNSAGGNKAIKAAFEKEAMLKVNVNK